MADTSRRLTQPPSAAPPKRLSSPGRNEKRVTLGADKGCDTQDHAGNLRAPGVTPHVAQNNTETKTGKRRKGAIDGRTTRHAGYKISQVRRKATGCIFGWGKQHGTLRKAKVRGIGKLGALFDINLARMPGLLAA